jgi:hypothetical protein
MNILQDSYLTRRKRLWTKFSRPNRRPALKPSVTQRGMAPEFHWSCSIAHPRRFSLRPRRQYRPLVQQPQCHSGRTMRTRLRCGLYANRIKLNPRCTTETQSLTSLVRNFDRAFAFGQRVHSPRWVRRPAPTLICLE